MLEPIDCCPPLGIELPFERPYPSPVRFEGAVEPIGPLAGFVARALERRRGSVGGTAGAQAARGVLYRRFVYLLFRILL